MELKDAKPGMRVAYVPLHISAYEDVTPELLARHKDVERGVITSCNDKYIFVRFDKQHVTQNGQACNPEDLYEL